MEPQAVANPNRAEIVSLTSLRGYLAVWVVAYHFWVDVVRLFPRAAALSPIVLMGNMAVPAFFMLSGFVITYNYVSDFDRLRAPAVGRFLGRRLARIYPVHLATLLVVLAMVWASARLGYKLTDAGYSTRDFVLNLLLIHTWTPDFQLNWNYPSWSISSEWFAYLLFPFAAAGFLNRLTTRLRASVALAVAVAGSVAVVLFWQGKPFRDLILVVPTFLVGAVICQLYRGRPTPPRPAVGRFQPELLTVAALLACYARPPALVLTLLLCGFAALIIALVRLGGAPHLVWTVKPAVYLGEVSYSLYMSHTLAQKVVYRLLPSGRFEGSPLSTRVAVLAAYIALVAAACLLTYYAIERPSRRLLKGVFSSKKPAKPAPQAILEVESAGGT